MALKKVTEVTGRAVYVPGDDIDTDRIIPARFMKCVTFDGLGEHLFHDVRFEETGAKKPHALNDSRFSGASILLSNANFGCGSSREHAPQAIAKYGFRAVIAESFAEIFFGNSTTLGMPCASVSHEAMLALAAAVEAKPETELMGSEDERRMILWNLGFFSTAESLTANNLVLAIYRHITNPEARQYLLRQSYEEAVHTDTFIYCCDTLGLDPDEIYNMYQHVPSIREKDQFVVEITKSVFDPNFTTEGKENIQKFVHDLVGFYVIMEGIFFYAGFVMMLSMLRKNRMVGVGEQFQFILRDESVHLAFGADLINTIVAENPTIWSAEFKQTLTDNIKKGVELEKKYVDDALPRGIVGLVPATVKQYIEHVADRRLERIGLERHYHVDNPFPWMSEIMDMPKEKNFFETRVTEYKTGELDW